MLEFCDAFSRKKQASQAGQRASQPQRLSIFTCIASKLRPLQAETKETGISGKTKQANKETNILFYELVSQILNTLSPL